MEIFLVKFVPSQFYRFQYLQDSTLNIQLKFVFFYSIQQKKSQPSMFQQMAATAGGVAVGSAIVST